MFDSYLSRFKVRCTMSRELQLQRTCMGDDDLHYVSSCGEACHSNLLFTFQQFFSSLLFQISHFISSISITHSISINVETHLKIRREQTNETFPLISQRAFDTTTTKMMKSICAFYRKIAKIKTTYFLMQKIDILKSCLLMTYSNFTKVHNNIGCEGKGCRSFCNNVPFN